jgi:hypothetical protein
MPDNNERPNADKVVALNEANAAAGLPPVSTNLRTPTPTPEDTLSPIYPKMSEIVDAAEHGNPIPVNDGVEVLEKPSPDGSDTMRKLMDTVDDTEQTDPDVAVVGEITGGKITYYEGALSTASASAINASNTAISATTTANQALASIGKLKRHVRDLRIGFVVLTVVLVGDLISHLVA